LLIKRVRFLFFILVFLLLVSCGAYVSPPPASLGTTENRLIPFTILNAPLTDQFGKKITLGMFRDRVVMLVPFLTLCQEVCPMTTGNLIQLRALLSSDSISSQVVIIEISVDPTRDNIARLLSYAKLAKVTWYLASESPTVLKAIAEFFGIYYQQVPEGSPPGIDWLTGKPLTYDVDHSDGFYLIKDGRLRFTTGAGPDFKGKLSPALRKLLDSQGVSNLKHPPTPSWTPNDAFSALRWVLSQSP
jgi:cytochrome oxidase Cu insertion factor (SCO1/SenC/PrrC family)